MTAYRLLTCMLTRKCGWACAAAGALLSIFLASPAQAQFAGESTGAANIKLGFNRNLISGAKYTLENNSTGESFTNSDSMSGNDVSAEFILFNRFGVELNVGLLPTEREYQLQDASGTLVANVDETATPILLSTNLYFQDLSTTGFKFFFGLGAGLVSVSHNLTGGTLGSDSSDVTVTVNLIKVGMDWLTDKAGFRAQVVSMEGSTQDGLEIPGFLQTIDYTATVATIGVFTFF